LKLLVDAYGSRLNSGAREPILHLRWGGGGEGIKHHAWAAEEDDPHVSREDLDDLERRGFLAITVQPRSWMVAVTPEGIQAVADHREQLAAAQRATPGDATSALSTDWSLFGPIVEAVVRGAELHWQAGGVTVRELEPLVPAGRHVGLGARLDVLERFGWVERFSGGTARVYRPSQRALQEFRAWPTGAGEAAGAALLQRIAEAMEDAPPGSEKRDKLGAFNGAAVDLGAKAIGEFLAKTTGVA
jgi:hypothetical protein